jgi:hypothetical protein
MYTIRTGSIFIEHDGPKNVGVGIAMASDNQVTRMLKTDDSVVYVAELEALLGAVEYIVNTQRIGSQTIKVVTSTPILMKHLNGDSSPQKKRAIKLHNQLEAWQDELDFIIEAKWIKSDSNPAQLAAREYKLQYLSSKAQN